LGPTTFDPILEVQELRRYRVFTPLASPQLGTALVLEPGEGAPLVIQAGDRVPESRLGWYRRSFLIDLGQYGLRLEEQLPSADPAFLFDASVTFSCRVGDPAQVAARNIRDMAAAVRLPLVRIMRTVARNYDISQFNLAEAALNDALSGYTGDAAVFLGSYLVELSVGGAAANSSAEYYDLARDTRLDGIRRRDMSDVVGGGRDELIAQWLAKHGGDPTSLLALEAESKRLESEHLLRAMGILTSSGDESEPFDTREERRRLLGRFLEDHGGAAELDRPVRRRLSGSLAPAEPVPDEPADSVAPAEPEAPRASRLRTPASAPAAEEPAPAPARDAVRGPVRVRGLRSDRPDRPVRGARPRDPDADGR
jgi:hypothetical protein